MILNLKVKFERKGFGILMLRINVCRFIEFMIQVRVFVFQFKVLGLIFRV
jgi:hypothetical protein